MKKIIILLIFFLLIGCSENGLDEKNNMVLHEDDQTLSKEDDVKVQIENLMAEKIHAISMKDLNLYMEQIYPLDHYYYNEQKRWFSEMTSKNLSDLKFEILEFSLEDENTAIVQIRESYQDAEEMIIEFPLKFILVDSLWYDAGYPFLEKKTDRYTLKYMPDETRVYAFLDVINTAYDNLADIFEEKPDPAFEIKLFTDQELLRQRSVPSIGWLFTGWGEANESLKIYTGHESINGYRGTLQHELIHHITMNICNNNLPGWLADGIALHYGNYDLEGGNPLTLGYSTKEDLRWSIEALGHDEMWDASSQEETLNWYNASAMYVAFIVDVYGHETLMEMFYEAGKKPYHENIMNASFKDLNNKTFDEVVESVLKIDTEALTNLYYEWLEKQ
ncbi:MAG: hypothetical protein JXR88_03885 [Clostridia bacterium]|nr:hypothetical protein [Clostridia bacterium]